MATEIRNEAADLWEAVKATVWGHDFEFKYTDPTDANSPHVGLRLIEEALAKSHPPPVAESLDVTTLAMALHHLVGDGCPQDPQASADWHLAQAQYLIERYARIARLTPA